MNEVIFVSILLQSVVEIEGGKAWKMVCTNTDISINPFYQKQSDRSLCDTVIVTLTVQLF